LKDGDALTAWAGSCKNHRFWTKLLTLILRSFCGALIMCEMEAPTGEQRLSARNP
jgi:hypothetical protein